jgi:hypothetical protein
MNVEIDAGVVPDGYEPVRVGSPKNGEQFVSINQEVFDCYDEKCLHKCPRLIVRKVWKPEISIPKGWFVYKSRGDGGWYATPNEPRELCGGYVSETKARIYPLSELCFVPPPDGKPRQIV